MIDEMRPTKVHGPRKAHAYEKKDEKRDEKKDDVYVSDVVYYGKLLLDWGKTRPIRTALLLVLLFWLGGSYVTALLMWGTC